MRTEFSRRATQDLQTILEYVARDNPQAAVRLIDRLEAAALRLSRTPHVGTRREDLAPGLRALSQDSYVIYFVSQNEDVLRIIRVLHGARNIEPLDFRPYA